jgi:hypothetical protein
MFWAFLNVIDVIFLPYVIFWGAKCHFLVPLHALLAKGHFFGRKKVKFFPTCENYITSLRWNKSSFDIKTRQITTHPLAISHISREFYHIYIFFHFQELIAPLQTSLKLAFDHTVGLSDNLSNGMNMIDSLQKYKRTSDQPVSEESSSFNVPYRPAPLPANWKSKDQLKETPQATVSPRVMGFEIHKPKIRIARLDMTEYRLALASVRTQPLPDQDNNIDTTENNHGDEVQDDIGMSYIGAGHFTRVGGKIRRPHFSLHIFFKFFFFKFLICLKCALLSVFVLV